MSDSSFSPSSSLPSKMKVARWYAPRDVRIEWAPAPTLLADHEAIVEVAWTGLCGSDLEEWREGPVVARAGVVLGHEIVGHVVRPARDGSGPVVGTAVVVDVVTGCGACRWCDGHNEGLCPQLVVTGQHIDGGLAQYVVGRADRLIEIPSHVDLRHAALAEPLAVAVRALRAAGGVAGRDVVVVGGGTVGLLVVQAALAQGAAGVACVEPSASKRAMIEKWGARAVWADSSIRRAELIREVMSDGPDVVVESAGVPESAAECVSLVRRGGTAVLLGVQHAPAPISTIDIVLGERTVVGSAAHMWDEDVIPAVSLLAAGAVDVEPLISATFELEETLRAFELLASGESGITKILVGAGSALHVNSRSVS